MSKITPVIMCGGSGTRLWPMSRSESPKQFQRIDINTDISFFQATVQRHQGEMFSDPVALVNSQHLGLVKRQLAAIQKNATIVIEPCSRNTAPALAVAALLAHAEDPTQILFTLPSDHLLSSKFNAVVASALDAVEEGYIITFGIKPTYPETGYGYITDGGNLNGFKTAHKVSKFTEKPPAEIAAALIQQGGSYWASGIALFRPASLLEEYERYAPDILEAARDAIALGQRDGNCLMLHNQAYVSARNMSCESAVLEKSTRIVLVPADVEWDDLGAWPAFHRLGEKTPENNVVAGDVLLVNTRNSYVRSEQKLVTVIGLSNIVVVDTADALLIADMNDTQAVKTAVGQLAATERREARQHLISYAEWGASKPIAQGTHFKLRQVTVGPGYSAPLGGGLQTCLISIVEGTAVVTSVDKEFEVTSGKTLEFEPETAVVIRNTGRSELLVIEMLMDSTDQALAVAAATFSRVEIDVSEQV
jgi:mannose-1-phosphate guanylyltransferase / mannose-6-phosphate isomerase